MRHAGVRTLFAMLMVSAAAAASFSAGSATEKTGIQAITRPSGDRVLSFVRPGLIMEMAVDKGDVVKSGQIIAKQDDREEIELLKVAHQEATSETEIEAEKAVLAADKLELQKKTDRGSEMEKREAALKVVVDEARIKLAIDKKRTAEFKYEANKAALEKLKLISPIDGVVQEVFMRVGEAPNGQELKVMRVIQMDPLWIETPVPIKDARKLSLGDPVNVLFTDGKVRPGKVALKDVLADPASGTLNIRVEVPNPEKLVPGENVRVTFGPSVVAQSGR